MPIKLTLINIPDTVYERLRAAAKTHRRSLSSEAIACLESVLLPTKEASSDRLSRARALRAVLPPGEFHPHDLDDHKHEGRP